MLADKSDAKKLCKPSAILESDSSHALRVCKYVAIVVYRSNCYLYTVYARPKSYLDALKVMPCMPTWNPKNAYVFLATSRILGWEGDYVEATKRGRTGRTETIRGLLSAPADFQKKESCCVIPGYSKKKQLVEGTKSRYGQCRSLLARERDIGVSGAGY